MKFPLPADTFPTLSLPLDDQDALKNLAQAFVDDAMVEYQTFRNPPLNGVIDDTRWKLIKKRDGLTSYLDRELGDPTATRNSVRESVGSMSFSRKLHGVLTFGTIDGSLHDQMYGMHHCSMELMRIKSAYMNDKIADGKILDEDLKQLLLWCPLPTDFSPLPLHQKSTLRSTSPGEKSRILAANDTQFYCLIAKRLQTRKSKKKNSPTRAKQSVGDDDSGDIVDDAVVFQFNQFVYHGSAQLPTSMLDDSGALAGRGFPLLRAQASDLAFAGVYEEILGPGGEHEAEFPRTKFLSRFATIHQRFQQEIGFVLLDLLIGAQKWVHDFVREVPTASGGNALIATHLARWLEIEDGSESFFELELARGSLCPFAQVVDEDQAYSEQQPLDLMVWKGIVHDALLGVIYCRGSFFMTLKSVSDGVVDDEASEQLFAGVPTYLNKGRGYLVRRLPSTAGTPAWLAGAKLLLWQTSVSLEREEQDEAQIQASESKTPCKDWFEDDAKAEGKTSTKAQSKPLSLRPAEFADEKISSIAVSKADKVARPHHVSRLSSSEALLALQSKARASAQSVPWDRRTGRPL
ncbi:hypothetical protein AM588_10007822 [Phytophthora nicotianae]|uniref:Uncharacterized protein n=1 Tax=Phytophthora nicotianae TaxID=4792 RepID=A0A0W8D874_PHYNI|nr:hypothetical protein AM588_10007822 [Phytophthora nicotianae]